jgi:hypothetical protein
VFYRGEWSISFFLLKLLLNLCCRIVSLPIEHDEIGVVDWDNLQIIETIDDEGRLQVTSDDQLYAVLGLKGEDERAVKARKVAIKDSSRQVPYVDVNFNSTTILEDDDIPDERSIVYDPDNLEFKLGVLFPSMADFRLAVRQYVINEEFELHVGETDKNRYDGYCKGANDCTWHVHR